MREGADSFLGLIMPAVVLNPGLKEILKKYEIPSDAYETYMENTDDVPVIHFRAVSGKELAENLVTSEVEATLRKENLRSMIMGDCIDSELLSRIRDKFSAVYSFDSLKGLFTKTSVSELKHASMIEEGEVFAGTADISNLSGSSSEPLSGAERGTAYHSIMELLDDSIYGDENLMKKALELGRAAGEANADESGKHPDRSEVSDRIYSFIRKKAQDGVIPESYKRAVWSPDIALFLATDLGQRMAAAYRRGQLMREKPFMMGVSAGELDPKFPESEMVLVQGIIDAWFIEDGEIVLLDYKTDSVSDEETLLKRYKVQLALYKRALEAATSLKVREVYIYSFTLGTVISL